MDHEKLRNRVHYFAQFVSHWSTQKPDDARTLLRLFVEMTLDLTYDEIEKTRVKLMGREFMPTAGMFRIQALGQRFLDRHTYHPNSDPQELQDNFVARNFESYRSHVPQIEGPKGEPPIAIEALVSELEKKFEA